MPWSPYADLDELIEELLGHWRRILGDGLAGAWIQGSFALGAADLYSDCDWIVASHAPLTKEQVAALRRIHDEIPTREGHWPHDIEGSYAPFDDLASVEHLGRRWWLAGRASPATSGSTARCTGEPQVCTHKLVGRLGGDEGLASNLKDGRRCALVRISQTIRDELRRTLTACGQLGSRLRGPKNL